MAIKLKFIKRFLELEAASGILLFLMAILSMVWANSALAYLHQRFIDIFLFTINEGLMAFFFLLVGLELKKSYIEGLFGGLSDLFLPLTAAFFGMLIPALIYLAFNYNDPETIRGWATPVATDIAFALGVLSLFGSRIPIALKLFLLALAIFDDVGAIFIIVIFYSHGLAWPWLMSSLIIMVALYILNRANVQTILPYALLGILLWMSFYHAGVHPTISGVLLALFIPNGDEEKGLMSRLEDHLHPWVAYLIMPLFALANAGFPLKDLSLAAITSQVALGIICGLFLGKQIGIFIITWLLFKLKWVKLPKETSLLQLYGVAILCGIGFTMSLFLGTLSFQNQNIYLAEVRLGVIVASILSSIAGATVLTIAYRRPRKH